MASIGINYGALAEPIKKQLLNQNCGVPVRLCKGWQDDADAITRLSVSGILSLSQASAARKKLHNKIIKRIQQK